MRIHRAPWSRWFVTKWFVGYHSYELQVGPLVIQVRRLGYVKGLSGYAAPLLNVFTDPYWR